MNTSFTKHIGEKFNRLTVWSIVRKYKQYYFFCKCDCGNIKVVKPCHVKNNKIRSCGCYNKEICSKRTKNRVSKFLKPNNYAAKYRAFKSYEKHANTRNLSFKLNLDQFVSLASNNCYYCGEVPKNSMNGRQSRSRFIYNGIDRVNNTLGYELNNCVTCCKHCNIAKHTKNRTEFFYWIKKVYEYNNL
jgi:hypothetical protein